MIAKIRLFNPGEATVNKGEVARAAKLASADRHYAGGLQKLIDETASVLGQTRRVLGTLGHHATVQVLADTVNALSHMKPLQHLVKPVEPAKPFADVEQPEPEAFLASVL